jgi:hypothetical protein
MLFALWEPALHRVTRDLDLLGFGHPSPERLADIFRELCRMEVEADGVDFDPRSVVCEDIRAQDEYAGIRVKLRATALARPWCRCRWMSVSATRCPWRRRKSLFP